MLQFIHSNFKLDLTFLKVTFLESNQWFKDELAKEIAIPFELNLNDEFKKNLEFSNHYNSTAKKTIYSGILERDGKLIAAILKIQDSKGDIASATITAGTDGFPNFDKKLSELPLESFMVDDIVLNAYDVIQKDYPETNYNFPMIHTDKYDPESEDWHGFLKIINNYAGGVFLKNLLDLDTNIDQIRNIMQPLPALMHVLNTAIQDAGYVLTGDILNDQDLQKAYLFRDGDYYDRLNEEKIPIVYKNNQWTQLANILNTIQHVEFFKEIHVEKKGDYILFGEIVNVFYRDYYVLDFQKNRSDIQVIIVKKSAGVETPIFNYNLNGEGETPVPNNFTKIRTKVNNIDHELTLEAGDKIKIYKREARRDQTPSITPDYPDAVNLSLLPIRFRNEDGTPIISVLNRNNINLAKVVPDATVRDLVTSLKNWKNYSFDYSEGVVYMNLIEPKMDRDSAIDISGFDVEEPTRTYHEDREFEISFSDGNSDPLYHYDSLLINREGVFTQYSQKNNISPIKIDALPLPVISRNGVTTALSFQEDNSKIRVVFFNSVSEGDKPVAFKNERMLIPSIYELYFKKWLQFRINSIGWNWDFLIPVERFDPVTIQTIVYAYSNFHIFTEVEKERINHMWWRITAKSESLN